MNQKSTAHKAEGLGSAEGATPNQKMSEGRRQTSDVRSVPQLDDEQLVLDTMMQALRGLKKCGGPRVSQIARDWERIFNYRIQVTMQERQRRAKARLVRLQVAQVLNAERGVRNEDRGLKVVVSAAPKVFGDTPNTAPETGALPSKITSSPSGVHIRLDASPGRD